MHYLIERYRRILATRGFELTPECKILDFGCGSGATVYAFRDDGFDCYGFDIKADWLTLRSEADRRYFAISHNRIRRKWDATIDPATFRLPYPDETFDFVFSNETMEHVQDHAAVLRELHRVMKRPGYAIHTFPSKYRFIEPHMMVPLGHLITAWPWYLLWAHLGLRNEPQRRRRTKPLRTALHNYLYARVGIRYLSPRQLARLGRRIYGATAFIPDEWEHPSRLRVPALYTWTKNVVWLLEKT